MAEQQIDGKVKTALELGPILGFFVAYLWLKDRVLLQHVTAAGETLEIGRQTTPAMLKRATAFKATILPPSTR